MQFAVPAHNKQGEASVGGGRRRKSNTRARNRRSAPQESTAGFACSLGSYSVGFPPWKSFAMGNRRVKIISVSFRHSRVICISLVLNKAAPLAAKFSLFLRASLCISPFCMWHNLPLFNSSSRPASSPLSHTDCSQRLSNLRIFSIPMQISHLSYHSCPHHHNSPNGCM